MKVVHEADLQPWTKIGEPQILASSFGASLIRQKFREPQENKEYDFSLVNLKEGNQICAVTSDANLLLVQQYKQGADEIVWEVPGGVAEANESPDVVAARELREETGYEAEQVLQTGWFWQHTRKVTTRVNTFVALNCHLVGKPKLDEHEKIRVVEVSPDEFWDLVSQGVFREPQSLSAVVMAALKYNAIPFPSI